MKKINKYNHKGNKFNSIDVDYYDLIELSQMGFKKNEIARELGIPVKDVDNLINEIEKDY